MEIKQPRRVLLLGPPDSGLLDLLFPLTGATPVFSDNTTVGLSHLWPIKTAYYTADVPIWIDEIPDVQAWAIDFSKTEAHEVVTALGAWIYVYRRPVTKTDYDTVVKTLKIIQNLIENVAGYAWDGTCLAVATTQSTTPYLDMSFDDWYDACAEYGFEFIDSEAKGKNEYGEPVGIARIKEAIEATDWEGGGDELQGEFREDGDEDFLATFAAEEAEMSLELLGLKEAVASGGSCANDPGEEERKVDEMEKMMAQILAIRDTGSAMPDEERKKFARRAVNDLLRSL